MDYEESPQELIKPIIELFSSGQIQEALDAVEALIKDYPNEPVPYNISGACYAGLGQFDAAIKNYKKAIAINPNYSEAHYNLAGTLQELGQLDGAVESYEKSLAIKPDYAEAHNNLGNALRKLNQLDTAITSYQKAIAIKPDYVEAYFSLGTTFEELGQLDDAVKSYKDVVNIEPDFVEMHNNLGVILNELNQNVDAIKSLERAVTIKPNFAEAHNNLGNVLNKLDQHDAALKSYEKAITIKPDYVEAHFNLGNVLNKLDQHDAALKSYEKAITIKPDYAEVHFNLGDTLRELGQLDEAVKCYEIAISIKVDFADAHNNLGVTLNKLGQLDEAVKCYEIAISIEVNFAEAHNNLAVALQKIGQQDKAIKCYKKALAIKPDYDEALNNLGIAYQQLGQINNSINQYEKALAINPDFSDAYFNLSYIKKYTASDPQITKMKSLLSDSKLSRSDRINLCFALAKVNENLDNQDELFKYLHEANRLRKLELNFSFDRSKTLFKNAKEMFGSSYSDIEKSLSSEPSTIHPIFIVGMPRSGSTLVEQIMSSHHSVHGAGELSNLTTIIGKIVSDNLTQGSDIASTSIGDKKINFSDAYSISKKAFLSIREQYLDALSNLNVPESVITDKFPINFLYIGLILTALPEAKIVHTKRDARAICWSIYSKYLKGVDFGNNFEDLAGFYGLYADLMDYWHQLFPGKIYDMCYEDLTTNQEEETRKLLQYCELDWDENCLSFHKNKRTVETASALQVRKKIYQGSSEAWKKHEAYLEPLIKSLNSF